MPRHTIRNSAPRRELPPVPAPAAPSTMNERAVTIQHPEKHRRADRYLRDRGSGRRSGVSFGVSVVADTNF
jgi:hypothetical protein